MARRCSESRACLFGAAPRYSCLGSAEAVASYVRMPGCLGFGLGWNLLASWEFKSRLRHGGMALALFKIDALVRNFVSCQCKDSGVLLLGPILGVNFGSSGSQKRGPSY